jgi:hypothetical protein
MRRRLTSFIENTRGTISIIAAAALPVVVGLAALATEYSQVLLLQSQAQRVADESAYAAALDYASSRSLATAASTASSVVALNSFPGMSATTTLVSSPSGDGNSAIKVVTSTSLTLALAQVIQRTSSVPVSATAYAEVVSSQSGCVIALQSAGSGISLSGGARINATACGVASNNTVSVPCGTTITTPSVTYGSSAAPSQPCSGISPPSGTGSVSYTRAQTADPLAGASSVTTATARLATVAVQTAPPAPSVSGGGDINFGYATASTQSQATADGCTATYAAPVWTLTCASGGTYNFGSLTLAGGQTLVFNTGGSAATTYNFSGSITTSSATAATFGPGIYNIARGIVSGGGVTTTFGAGTFNIGPGTAACSGGGIYSLCNTATLRFGGPSIFKLAAGVYNGGGATLVMGTGTSNSFQIGASSDGNAFYGGGGAVTTFADATWATSTFQMTGNVNMGSGGGSCLTLGAAAQHDIKGNVTTAGGTTLGAGVYTVTGYVALGASGGGDVTCSGTTVGVNGSSVTLVIGAAATPASGTCAGQAFCIASGYSNVTLTAPTSGTTSGLAVVGPTTGSVTAGAALAEGASNTSVSGTIYFPNGPLTLSGGATLGSGAGQCLELIASQITESGGTATSSACAALNSTTLATARLVK